MFVVAIRRTGAETTEPVAGLRRERTNFGQHFICDIQYDGSRFQLKTNHNAWSLIDTALSDAEACRLSFSEPEGVVSKSFMLGLPIYYAEFDSGIVFATQVRLLRHAGIQLKEDPRALPEYFVYRYVSPPKTLFQGVNCIPVGSTLRFRPAADQVKIDDVAWTAIFNKTERPLRFAESVEAIADDMREGMRSLQPSRDHVACLLSGGVDSSMLYKLGKDYLSLSESHSTGYSFEDQERNGERDYAEAAAHTFGSTHRYHSFSTEQYLHGLIDSVDHAEVPVIHLQSVLIELLFGQALGPRNRIVLNGQGADGIFGSTMMWWYQKYRRLILSPFSPLLGILGNTPANRSFPYRKLYAWSKRDWSLNLAKTNHALWLLGETGEKNWVKNYFRVGDEEIVENRLAAICHFRPESVLDAFSILDLVSDVDLTQIIWGQIAAAHGKRVHYSFNSPGIISAAFNTSWKDKLLEQKRLGRAVAERLGVPQSILARPKLSFGVPSARWAGPRGVIESLLKVVAPVVDVEMLRQFQGADEKKAMIYWSWINYAIWKRLLINGESSQTLHAELEEAIHAAPK
jgi:asparagine synthetase B (glutamine-hydrolysing)